jgi:hypothetical protein
VNRAPSYSAALRRRHDAAVPSPGRSVDSRRAIHD